MFPLTYLGNALDAAGWRLAGAQALAPAPGTEAQAFTEALQTASLVLLSAEVARALPAEQLDAALAALHPLVLLLPDPASTAALPADPAQRVRRQLGIESPADGAPTETA